MNLLTVDRGNSTWDLAAHARAEVGAVGELVARERIAIGDDEHLRSQLALWREVQPGGGAEERPRAFVASSVVTAGLEPLREVLAIDDPTARLVVAGLDLRCPMPTDYPDPDTLGVDRWLGALAGHARYGAVVTVDCGTALTVNVVDVSGRFRGGAIGPGATTMACGLASRAPGLPGIGEWSDAVSYPNQLDPGAGTRADAVRLPIDSSSAVTTGVALAFCGAVERLVRDLTLGAGCEGATRVLTGGEAAVYKRHGRLVFENVPDLVHRGLAELWRTRPSNF